MHDIFAVIEIESFFCVKMMRDQEMAYNNSYTATAAKSI